MWEHGGRGRGDPGSTEVAGGEVLLGRGGRSCFEFPGRAGTPQGGAEVGGFSRSVEIVGAQVR